MRIGIFATKESSLLDNLKWAIENGFNWMEFRPSDFKLNDIVIKKVGKESIKNEINLIIHTSDLNINLPLSFHDLNLLKNELKIAKTVKAKMITIHSGKLNNCYSVRKQLKFLIKNLEKIMGFCGDMLLGLENSVSGVIRKRKDYVPILHSLPDLKIVLDVGHLVRVGEKVEVFIEKLNKFICNVHLHNVKGGKDHLPISSGEIDILKILECFKKVGYQGPFILEFFSRKELLKGKKLMKVYDGL